jgi:hypothetical protein
VPAHPHDHEGHDPDRADAHGRLEHLLLALRQVLIQDLERHADAAAQQHGDEDVDPDVSTRVALFPLAQARGDDPDDQCRLEALVGRARRAWRSKSN